MSPPQTQPSSLDQAVTQHRLNLCKETNQHVHARSFIAFVSDTLSAVTQCNRTIGNYWDQLCMKHGMRNADSALERVYEMLAASLIEIKMAEEQDMITHVVTGSVGAAKPSQWDDSVSVGKGKGQKGKGKGQQKGKTKWERDMCRFLDARWSPSLPEDARHGTAVTTSFALYPFLGSPSVQAWNLGD